MHTPLSREERYGERQNIDGCRVTVHRREQCGIRRNALRTPRMEYRTRSVSELPDAVSRSIAATSSPSPCT
jgi:hypothetical protein